jgi:hypothetical protein
MSGVMPTAPQRAESAQLADDRFRDLGGPRWHDSYGDKGAVPLEPSPAIASA